MSGKCAAKCPCCGEEKSIVQVMKRTVGYYANVENMHEGKQEECKDRVTYDLKKVEGLNENKKND